MLGNSEDNPRNQEMRRRAGDLHSAFFAGKEVAGAHTQRRDPELKSRLEATRPYVVGRMNAAISARVAGKCDSVLGQELMEDGETLRADLAREAKRRELNAWKRAPPERLRLHSCGTQQVGAHLGYGEWEEKREGSPGRQGFPGPGLKGR